MPRFAPRLFRRALGGEIMVRAALVVSICMVKVITVNRTQYVCVLWEPTCTVKSMILWFTSHSLSKNTATTVQPRIPSKGEASTGAEMRNPPWHSTCKLHRVEHKITPCRYFNTRTADARLANPSPALPSSSPQKTPMDRRQTEPLGFSDIDLQPCK